MRTWMMGVTMLLGGTLTVVAAEGDPVWLPSFEKGKQAAAKSGKPIFLVFR